MLEKLRHSQMPPAGYTSRYSWLLQGLHTRRRGGSPHFLVALSRVKMMLHAVHTPLAQSTHCGSMALHGLTVGEGTGTCMHGVPVACWDIIRCGQCCLFTRAGSTLLLKQTLTCHEDVFRDVMHAAALAGLGLTAHCKI